MYQGGNYKLSSIEHVGGYRIPFLIKNQIDDEFIKKFISEFHNIYKIKGNRKFSKCERCSFFIAYNLRVYGLDTILNKTCNLVKKKNIYTYYKKLNNFDRDCFKIYLSSILVDEGYLDEIESICNKCIVNSF